ncbi:hypothetical protein M1203_36430 [Streptomyces sp. 35G-GA-8]|nr:hypothetical protein [Streptomyces sp. 35G-GA-8]
MEPGREADDPDLETLVSELSLRSERFRRLWARHDVRGSTNGGATITHPRVGTPDPRDPRGVRHASQLRTDSAPRATAARRNATAPKHWHPVRETFEPLPCRRLIRLDRRDAVGVFVLEKEAAWACEVLRRASDSSQTHVKRSNLTCSHSDR